MSTPYSLLLLELKSTIRDARYRAVRQVNRALIELYWNIGRRIVESQAEHGWGKSVVEQLSQDLRIEFPENVGLSQANLWEMRRFYLTYKDFPNLQTLSRDLGWSNNRQLLSNKIDLKAKEYYLRKAAEGNWSFRVLHQKIKAQSYERSLLDPSQNNFRATLPEDLAEQTEELVKSSYNLDFLGLKEEFKEKELEDRILNHLQAFMLELGYGYTFVGRQYRLTLNKDYHVDLLFFNRKLRALVAVELKTEPFKPSFIGTLNFHLEIMDDQVRMPDENPSIGILLCSEKDDLEVEYALRAASRPMGVVNYKTETDLPEDLAKYLPSPHQLKQQIEVVKQEFYQEGKK